MSYSEIEVWLLNTILGLIVLGAIGSIAGSIFLWIVVKMAKASVGFLVEKSNQMLSSFIVNITISYMRSYLRARELVNIAHTKPTVVPIGILYAKTLRRQFFYSSFAALCFFISVMLFVLFGVEYPKTSIFFVAMTFLYSHDAIVYSAYLNIIENLHLKESEKQTNEMFLNRDAVLDETIKLMDDRIADRKKKKLGEI